MTRAQATRRADSTAEGASAEALEESLRQGFTLPAEWYTDQAIFAAERVHIFRRSWQFAGFTEQLAEPGSFFSVQVAGAPLVLTRDLEGQLHAFINVCRHRGSELVQAESGRRQTLQCAYHAWTYNLNGSLRSAPGAKDEPGFNPVDFPLMTVPLETWGPLLFVNLDPQAAQEQTLQTLLGELPRLTDASGAELGALRRRARHSYTVAANWKVVVDNYLECYHCPIAHKGFSAVIDTNQYTVSEYDWFSVQMGALKSIAAPADRANSNASAGLRAAYATQGKVQAGFYAYLWPNFTLNVYPGHGNVSINIIAPLAVDRTLIVKDYCFSEQVGDDEASDFVRFVNQVQEEDNVLCESVQRGLGSGYFARGRLMLRQESALRHFQRLVARELRDEPAR